MNVQQFTTEAPYVLSTPLGRKKSEHWTQQGALTAAKASATLVIVHGRDKGLWKPLLAYKGGKRVTA